MKTIFVNGLMPERSLVFLKHLTRSFRVIGSGLTALAQQEGLDVVDPFSITGALDNNETRQLEKRIDNQTRVLADQLVNDIRANGHGPRGAWQLAESNIQGTLRPRVARLLNQQAYFSLLLAKTSVDMVISGADYGSHARVIARTARNLGLPTLNLEHGFFFSQLSLEFFGVEGHMPMFFTSEFVNLDSALEVDFFSKLTALFPNLDNKFLALGTPVDTVAGQKGDQESARRSLGLSPDKKVLSLFGSWIEARSLNNLIRGQIDTVNTYEDIFRSLAASESRYELELLIKLHPAESRPDVFPSVKGCLENMAQSFGLPQPHVFGDHLPEVLHAADVVAAIGFSSVLYDAFQLGKPSLVLTPPFLVPCADPRWRQRGNVPLTAGVMESAIDGADLWRRAAAWLEPSRQEKLKADIAELTSQYDLQYGSVEQKSAKIVEWIDHYLDSSAAGSAPPA